MSSITQEHRFFSISDFSQGKDTFIITSLEGSEYISDLFEVNVEVISENLAIKPDDIVGKSGDITMHNENERVFHGFVRSFTVGEIVATNLRQYKMSLVPWLWFLSKTNNHRIFQDKNAKDIISQIFQDLGFTDFDFRAAGGKPREYCIQHNESDLHFVSRLMEEEGIAYFFKHESGKHKMIIVDQKNAYDDFAETDLEYSNGSSPDEQISRWEHLYNFKKGQWSFADYNYEDPTKKLFANTKTTSKFANNGRYEHYEYPGMYDFGSGDDLVKIRLDAEEAGIDLVSASSDCTTFYAGGKFKVAKHESKTEKGEYIVVSIHHRAFDSTHIAGGSGSGSTGYTNNFICIPSSVHFRPEPVHPKPVMRGPQSAIVTGPSGEEIYVDDLGRIKVQFYWDREGKKDENTTCYIRVMQTWAGAQWGASFIPRIGHEVIVDFLDGDPDRPIITGTVYNGKNKPPFSSKTQSGIRTRSSKSGTAANCNELIFDDKKGSEQFNMHAEKDMNTVVENDETLSVGNDRTKTIDHDENSTISNDRNKTVGNNQSEKIGGNKTIKVDGNHSETVNKNVSISVSENHTETVGKNMKITISQDLTESVSGSYSESVTKAYNATAKTITMEAADQITLKTGSAKIIMKKSGDITISGKNINVKGSGNIVLKGSKISEN